MTKSEAWDIIKKALEREDEMENVNAALIRIRGTYYGIMARGVEEDAAEEDDGKRKDRTSPSLNGCAGA